MKYNLQLVREELVLVSDALDKSLQSLPQVTWHLGIYGVLDFTLSPLKGNINIIIKPAQYHEFLESVYFCGDWNVFLLGDKLACIVSFHIGIIKPW